MTVSSHSTRLIAFLLLALCIVPASNKRLLGGTRELSSKSVSLYVTPQVAGAASYIVESPQLKVSEFTEQQHSFVINFGTLVIEFVRATSFLSNDFLKGFLSRHAYESIPARAPPFIEFES